MLYNFLTWTSFPIVDILEPIDPQRLLYLLYILYIFFFWKNQGSDIEHSKICMNNTKHKSYSPSLSKRKYVRSCPFLSKFYLVLSPTTRLVQSERVMNKESKGGRKPWVVRKHSWAHARTSEQYQTPSCIIYVSFRCVSFLSNWLGFSLLHLQISVPIILPLAASSHCLLFYIFNLPSPPTPHILPHTHFFSPLSFPCLTHFIFFVQPFLLFIPPSPAALCPLPFCNPPSLSSLFCVNTPLPLDVLGVWWTHEGAWRGLRLKVEGYRGEEDPCCSARGHKCHHDRSYTG